MPTAVDKDNHIIVREKETLHVTYIFRDALDKILKQKY